MPFKERDVNREQDGKFGSKTGGAPEVTLPVDAGWRERKVVTAAGARALGSTKSGTLYHGSPVKLGEGDILSPQAARRYKQSSADSVSLTSDPAVATRWARDGGADNPVYLYEVEPLGELEAHRVGLEGGGAFVNIFEARSPQARIIGVQEVPAP